MFEPNMFVLYVDNPNESRHFYQQLFDIEPLQASDTFVLFKLKTGFQFALWSKHTVLPSIEDGFNECFELCVKLSDKDAVKHMHERWLKDGLPVIQVPTMMDFGYTFVGYDNDKKRLRFYVLNEV